MKKKILSFIMVLSVFNLSFFSMDDYGKVLAHNEQTNEIIALRTLNEKHFDNGDGTRTAYIDTSPLHFYENGRWVNIDNTLIKD